MSRPTPTPPNHLPRALRADWGYRALVVGIVVLAAALSMWTGAQAHAVDERLDRSVRSSPSIRQVEHAEQARAERIEAARDHDERRFANRVDASSSLRLQPDLLTMEHSELQRFRNRAPASALPAIDTELERLRRAIDGRCHDG